MLEHSSTLLSVKINKKWQYSIKVLNFAQNTCNFDGEKNTSHFLHYNSVKNDPFIALVTLNNSSDNLSKSSGRSRSQGKYNFLNWPIRTPDMLQLTNHRTGNVEFGHPERRNHWHELPTINHSVLVSPSQYNFLFLTLYQTID